MPYYADVIVVVDGAIEDEEQFFDYLAMSEFLDTVKDEAADHGYLTEVYVVHHEHELSDDCACVQYLQDHTPTHVYNAP